MVQEESMELQLPAGLEMTRFEGEVGRALIATRAFAVGETLFRETPLVQWTHHQEQHRPDTTMDDDKASAKFVDLVEGDTLLLDTIRAFPTIDPRLYSRIQDFARPPETFCHPMIDKLRRIHEAFASSSCAQDSNLFLHFLLACYTNAHHSRHVDATSGQELVRCGLFEVASKMAHACDPSCVFFFRAAENDGTSDDSRTASSFEMEFLVVKPIAAGDVVTCSYLNELDLLMPVSVRRERLLERKFFTCQCQRCCLEECAESQEATERKEALRLCAFLDGSFSQQQEELEQDTNANATTTSMYSLWEEAARLHRRLGALQSSSATAFIVQLEKLPQQLAIATFLFYRQLFARLVVTNVHPLLFARWFCCGTGSMYGDMPSMLELLGWNYGPAGKNANENVHELVEEMASSSKWNPAWLDRVDAKTVEWMVATLAFASWKYLRQAKACRLLVNIDPDEWLLIKSLAQAYARRRRKLQGN